jgi:glycosyltransferase involved in cell wall biosynthesis
MRDPRDPVHAEPVSVRAVLCWLIFHPWQALGRRWNYKAALLEAANAARRHVRVIVPGTRSRLEEVGGYGRIYQLPAPRAPAFDRRYRMIMPNSYLPWWPSRIVEILERERPDVVEISDKYSLPYLAAMLRKGWHPRVPRPVLLGLTHERFDDSMAAYVSESVLANGFSRWYVRHIYGPPFDAHLAVSEYTASELREALSDRAPWFIRVCQMGVDSDGFGSSRRSALVRRELQQRVGGSERTVLLIYAGRLSPEKNVDLLVDVIRELSRDSAADYRFVVAGEGPAANRLHAHTRRIWLCGNLDKATLAQYCANCDVFVHPNPREPFGIGPLEAMASAVPVVVPNAGGVLEYASPSNAWLAAPTVVAFADAIRAASRKDSDRLATATETVRSFHWGVATRR